MEHDHDGRIHTHTHTHTHTRTHTTNKQQCSHLPLADSFERADARDVKHNHRADRLFVVDARHVAEPLLASNVPQLQAHFGRVVPANHLQRKVDTNLHGGERAIVSATVHACGARPPAALASLRN